VRGFVAQRRELLALLVDRGFEFVDSGGDPPP
jgi:hypothetical protein